MDLIGSTYNSTSAIDSLSANRLRQQDDAAYAVLPDQGEYPPAKSAAKNSDVQQGIQPSGDSGAEFHPYGPDGLQKQQTSDTSKPQNKSPQPAQPGDIQQADSQIQQVIAQLKSTEEKVKAHEAAHKSGGAATGPISYTYTRGPDGKSYITGGEVPITLSSGQTPQETISRMQQVIQAALAPSDPSPQDRAVAAQAAAMQQAARQEQTSSQASNGGDTKTSNDTDKNTKAETTQNDSITQQSRRAYSDPAVTGNDVSTTGRSHRNPQKTSHENNTSGPADGSGTSNYSSTTSTAVTDGGLSQMV